MSDEGDSEEIDGVASPDVNSFESELVSEVVSVVSDTESESSLLFENSDKISSASLGFRVSYKFTPSIPF